MEETISDIIIYQVHDGDIRIETRLEDETVWLTQGQMVELFGKSKSTISEHIKKIFLEKELIRESVVRDFRTTASDGKNYVVTYYNLDIIISVGYRVKSLRGTQFRIWATKRLREYIVKGFTMNDELLKNNGQGVYFEELLTRIRDIRSSEKVFWRKILDLYATSIDYNANDETTIKFFKVIQNKMHWATHGHTAAEIIYKRVNAEKPNLGLTNFKGSIPTTNELEVAKNYLSEQELNLLNKMVAAYLEIAELQALNKKPMYMKDWVTRLDDFLRMTGSEVLENAGKISREQAIDKAKIELNKFCENQGLEFTHVELDFMKKLDLTEKQLRTFK